MNSLQKSYHAFIESVCNEFGCTDAIHPLQEGFSALCEADSGDTRTGSAWDDVEWIHVYHATDPRMDIIRVRDMGIARRELQDFPPAVQGVRLVHVCRGERKAFVASYILVERVESFKCGFYVHMFPLL